MKPSAGDQRVDLATAVRASEVDGDVDGSSAGDVSPLTIWVLNHHAGVHDGQSRAFDIGRYLVSHGHAVTVLAAGRNHYTGAEDREYDRFGQAVEWVDGVRFIWIRTGADRTRRIRNMSAYASGATRACLQLDEKPDVVVGSCPHPLAGLAAYFLARRKGARFYYEIRDLWPQSGVDQGLLKPRSATTLLLSVIERFLLSRADGVVTVLENLAGYLNVKRIRQPNVWFVPNGADLSRFPRSNSPSPNADRFRLLYVGGFANYHGLQTVVDAATLLRDRGREDIEIEMFGGGPLKQPLIDLCRERDLDNVRFGPHLPKEELAALLQTADVTLFTFRRLPVLDYGISPLKIFDYMAASRPVIFAAAAYNDPIAQAGAGVTVPPDDPNALADAIERCADMPREELEAMGRRGREFVEAHHSVEVLGRRYELALAHGRAG